MAYTAQNIDNKWIITDDDGNTHNVFYEAYNPITEQEAITIAQNIVASVEAQ